MGWSIYFSWDCDEHWSPTNICSDTFNLTSLIWVASPALAAVYILPLIPVSVIFQGEFGLLLGWTITKISVQIPPKPSVLSQMIWAHFKNFSSSAISWSLQPKGCYENFFKYHLVMQNTHFQQSIKEKKVGWGVGVAGVWCFDISKVFPASFTESIQIQLKFTNLCCCCARHLDKNILGPNIEVAIYLLQRLTWKRRLAEHTGCCGPPSGPALLLALVHSHMHWSWGTCWGISYRQAWLDVCPLYAQWRMHWECRTNAEHQQASLQLKPKGFPWCFYLIPLPWCPMAVPYYGQRVNSGCTSTEMDNHLYHNGHSYTHTSTVLHGATGRPCTTV